MLARRLPGISGRFMPSVNDVAQMRAMLARSSDRSGVDPLHRVSGK